MRQKKFGRKKKQCHISSVMPVNPVKGWVYVVRTTVVGRFKIGKTNNIDRRLAQLRTVDPDIELVMAIPSQDTTVTELDAHYEMRQHHYKGELFDIPEEELERLRAWLINETGVENPRLHSTENTAPFLSCYHRTF